MSKTDVVTLNPLSPNPKNGQTQSNNYLAIVDKSLECV